MSLPRCAGRAERGSGSTATSPRCCNLSEYDTPLAAPSESHTLLGSQGRDAAMQKVCGAAAAMCRRLQLGGGMQELPSPVEGAD